MGFVHISNMNKSVKEPEWVEWLRNPQGSIYMLPIYNPLEQVWMVSGPEGRSVIVPHAEYEQHRPYKTRYDQP